jgi:hypothetical protein
MALYRLFGRGRVHAGREIGPDDQRKAYRYLPVDHEARLGWWLGEAFTDVPAYLGDVGHHGALILTEYEPPTTEVVVRLVRPVGTDWVLGQVVRSVSSPSEPTRLGVRFAGSCPYEVFRQLKGLRLDTTPVVAAPEDDSRFWR